MIKIFFIFLSFNLLLSCNTMDSSGYKGNKTPHFDGKYFHNLEEFPEKSFFNFLSMRLSTSYSKWPDPFFVPYKKVVATKAKSFNFSVINHSTVLIQGEGITILTDPIWSKRCSPFSWIGPKRVRNPGIQIEDLPPIDVILISHNHYDHMDIPTLQKLAKKHDPLILVGLGNKQFLQKFEIHKVEELDWWQSFKFKNHEITFTPGQHFSGRGLFDRMQTLWGSFVVKTSSYKIFFAGDTAYAQFFREIHKKFGNMDLSFIPIGAYSPRSFMKAAHVNTEEAIKIHKDLASKQSVGIHFETFQLTAEAFNEPRKALEQKRSEMNIAEGEFFAPKFGEFYNF